MKTSIWIAYFAIAADDFELRFLSDVTSVLPHLPNSLACSLIFLTLKAINCTHSFIKSKTTWKIAILTVQIYEYTNTNGVGYGMVWYSTQIECGANQTKSLHVLWVDFTNIYYHFFDSLGLIHNWKSSLRWVYWL